MNRQELVSRILSKERAPEVAVAFFLLDSLTSAQMVAVAERLLVAGYDSPSLRILAGETQPLASECMLLFRRAMSELNIQMPDRLGAVRTVIKAIAQMILDGNLPPQEGAATIVSWVLEFGEADKELGRIMASFDLLDIAMEEAGTGPCQRASRAEVERLIREEARKLVEDC